MDGAFGLVWVLVLVLVVATVFAGMKTVPQGQVWTVERFGAFMRELHPGLNFLIPYIDRVGRKLNVQEQVSDIPEQSVITKDNATVAVDGVIYFRVMEAAKAAYQVTNLEGALSTLAMTNIRAVIGEMELDAALSSRERINAQLLAIMDGVTDPWGVKVSRVEIRRIEPPENLIRAMNLQMTAERLVVAGRGREWRKVRPRNEALDCRVYAMAALHLLAPRLEAQPKAPVPARPWAPSYRTPRRPRR